jgi:hypothetical protein
VLGVVLAAQIAIVARGPDTASACQPFEVTVAARAFGTAVPRIALPLPAGGAMQLLRSRVVSRTEQDVSGLPSTISEGSFLVATDKVGRVSLPAFVASVGARDATAAPVSLDVRESDAIPPLVIVRASLGVGNGRPADAVYVGQQVDYVVDVHLNESARQRLRRNPTFFPPEMSAVLAYDLPMPGPFVRGGRRCFETLSYRRALFPLFSGATAIAPAALTYSLPLSSSFFAREETYELRTDSVHFVAMDAPAAARPADYAGAVGAVRGATWLSASSGRMGDPVVLTMRLNATGNVKLLPRPALTIDWATIALGEERVTVDSTAARVRGTKEFDWLLTPRRAGSLRVPAIRYPFFDPERGAYDVAVTDSLPLDVAPAALASADTSTVARLPVRTRLRAERPPDLASRAWYWALLLAAPAPAAVTRLRVRRRPRTSTRSGTRRLRALALARTTTPPRDVRRAFLDALCDRVAAVGTRDTHVSLAGILRRAGVTDATARQAEELLERLDAAAFSPAGAAEGALVKRAAAVAAAVDTEAERAAPTTRAVWLVVSTALLTAGVATAALPDGVERTFGDGVRAYQRGEWATAERLFARAAARAPRAPDAWANLGTAAWAASDTARAALGWQRALRLEPIDEESRQRLAVLQAPLMDSPAYVAPLSGDAVALSALALWIVAWLALAIPAARRPHYARAVAGGALTASVVALAVALELGQRGHARGLAVLRGSRTLLASPAFDAPPSAAASAGEVGRVGRSEAGWVRITLDDRRGGWLPVAAVLPLDDGLGAD